eukprot:UN31829
MPWRYPLEYIWDVPVKPIQFPTYTFNVVAKSAAFNPCIICMSKICSPRLKIIKIHNNEHVRYLAVVRINGKNQCDRRIHGNTIYGTSKSKTMANAVVFLTEKYRVLKQVLVTGDAGCSEHEKGAEFEDGRLFIYKSEIWINSNCGWKWRSYFAPLEFNDFDNEGLPNEIKINEKRGFYPFLPDVKGFRNLLAFEHDNELYVHWWIQPHMMINL